ncbi:SigE family RNA polymerase sigma factor [Actinosynnema pretiosum subsp. pretiosum]|uniref:RNA polymerase sigma factor n=2 Tax=Actinosynnema TaxID=40566 RepID=C6W8I8_ACTMD|nr:SigE family RNA polymerase sigma factor [Actinosynnema mirum]ACU39035.1 RNA polymerase, sigma-24 subunit, ECF subfamily [Actinosynnema mirum DSM 43827]AXX32628.1 RNA polymerase ECF sigma factor [Actinosynnema pretiosum subsp. pretiosum]QUF03479.1 SigE family RNA polymerase sigma factor [Actinosynnema pretiosum subsp. pretiosum]
MKRDEEFTRFYTGHFDQARRTAYAMCGNWSDAEEITQNAFVRVYSAWARVRSETAEAYLRTVVTRVFLDTRRRRRGREQAVAEPPERPVPPDTESAEHRQNLIPALQELPPRQRAVIVLRFVHDLSVEQVAQTMGCTQGTVKSQTSRGLEALRRAFPRAHPRERT